MPHEAWKLLDSRTVAQYKTIRVREDRYHFAPGQLEADFVVCESPDWVIVLPFTVDQEVVFVRQYRHGVRQVVLEAPGGLLDPGESPAEAAARELAEETGYTASEITILGTLLPNPALNTALCHVALAQGCRRTRQMELDPLEQIDVVLEPWANVPALVRSGQLVHAQVLAALYLLELGRQ